MGLKEVKYLDHYLGQPESVRAKTQKSSVLLYKTALIFYFPLYFRWFYLYRNIEIDI